MIDGGCKEALQDKSKAQLCSGKHTHTYKHTSCQSQFHLPFDGFIHSFLHTRGVLLKLDALNDFIYDLNCEIFDHTAKGSVALKTNQVNCGL